MSRNQYREHQKSRFFDPLLFFLLMPDHTTNLGLLLPLYRDFIYSRKNTTVRKSPLTRIFKKLSKFWRLLTLSVTNSRDFLKVFYENRFCSPKVTKCMKIARPEFLLKSNLTKISLKNQLRVLCNRKSSTNAQKTEF